MSVRAGTVGGMSDESTEGTEIEQVEAPTEAELETYARERNSRQPDTMLAIFVDLANRNGEGVGVTLTVGGSLISGTIVGRVQWIDGIMERYGEQVSGFRAFREVWTEQVERFDSDEPMAAYESIIHVKDARWWGGDPDSPLPTEGAFWRGRLDQIQGWSLGTLGANSQGPDGSG